VAWWPDPASPRQRPSSPSGAAVEACRGAGIGATGGSGVARRAAVVLPSPELLHRHAAASVKTYVVVSRAGAWTESD
jgi:hypothetical protein